MDLNELYKEIEKAEVDLNAKRLKYIKEALVENGGSRNNIQSIFRGII
jgi:hypothetical protein